MWLEDYMEYSENLGYTKTASYWTGISTISAALAGKCYISLHATRLKANNYIVLVAESGKVRKSSAMALGYDLLKKMDLDYTALGLTSGTWQGVADWLHANERDCVVEGVPEKLASLSADIAELGSFFITKDQELAMFLIAGWDAKQYDRLKVSGSYTIAQPFFNFITGTTPNWLATNLPKNAGELGVLSRFLFAVETNPKRRKNTIESVFPTTQQAQKFSKVLTHLLTGLHKIARLEGEFSLTQEAMVFYVDLLEEIDQIIFKDASDLPGFMSRKAQHILKTAMALAAADFSKEIEMKHLKAAKKAVEGLEPHLDYVYNLGGSDIVEIQYRKRCFILLRDLCQETSSGIWINLSVFSVKAGQEIPQQFVLAFLSSLKQYNVFNSVAEKAENGHKEKYARINPALLKQAEKTPLMGV